MSRDGARLSALLALLTLVLGCARAVSPPLEPVRAPNPTPTPLRPITFPLDDGPHDNLTEWWYYTGHLFDPDGGLYGFEFVIFQVIRGDYPVAYVAHAAVTDGPRGRFWHDQRARLGTLVRGTEGAALEVDGWTLRAANGRDAIGVRTPIYSFDLRLESVKPPVLHGPQGYVDFGPVGGSYYYSRTRMLVSGTLHDGEASRPVQGQAWMDHQWGDFLVVGGWDWFSLQLDDQTELMLFMTRLPDGAPGMTLGTFVEADGRAVELHAADFTVVPLGTWTSPHTGATYPSGWRVLVPAHALDLELTPTQLDQELLTTETTGLTYWEGQVRVRSLGGPADVTGLGYVELTGYAPAGGPAGPPRTPAR